MQHKRKERKDRGRQRLRSFVWNRGNIPHRNWAEELDLHYYGIWKWKNMPVLIYLKMRDARDARHAHIRAPI